ncbi:hypothetical protein Tco_1319920 [Tanacetum coccineum]|uniref:Uncharacterized protein n=1 Tax=Tanacetum coccineum TaxID=301880 RepID=A0ABQ5BTT7_9ASTR
MVTNSNPSRGRMSPKSTTRDGEMKALWGVLSQSATSAISTINGPCTRGATRCNQEMAFLLAIVEDNYQNKTVQNRRIKIGGIEIHKMGYAVGNAEKRGNAPGNPDANVVTEYENKDIPRTGNFDDLCGNEPLRVPVEVVRKVIQNVNLLDSEGTISPYTSIDSRGIHGDPPDRSIKDWASPKTPTEIRQFLGLAVTIEGSLKDFRRLLRSEDFVVVLDAVTQRLRCGVNAA